MSISVAFSNPHAVYYPGTEVSGVAILNLDSSVKARSVCVEVDGRAHCHWTESESYTERNSDGTTTTRSRSIDFSASLVYVTGEAVVWCGSGDKKLPAGRHEFPFRFLLPAHCAPSFEGSYGYIRYKVTVEIDRVWKFNKSNRRFFTVAPTFDLNAIPQAITPVINRTCKNVGMVLFKHGKISVEVRLPKSGFVPGEAIVMDAFIDNDSSRPVVSADLKLKQVAHFTAVRHGWTGHYQPGLTIGCGGHHRQLKRVVAETSQLLNVAAKSKGKVQLAIPVPPTVPSFNVCPIIKVEYFVSFKLTSKGNISNTLKSGFAVLLGTVPLYQMTVVQPQPSAPAPGPSTVPYPVESAPHAPVYPTMPTAPSAEAEAPPPYPVNDAAAAAAGFAPPSYEESVYGTAGTTKDMQADEAFAPRYPFYSNLANAPPLPSAPTGEAAPAPGFIPPPKT